MRVSAWRQFAPTSSAACVANCIEWTRSKIKFVRQLLFQNLQCHISPKSANQVKRGENPTNRYETQHVCSFLRHTAQTAAAVKRIQQTLSRFTYRPLNGGGAFSVPHILNLTYHSACLSCRITITMSGVGGYPLDLKKLKTVRRVKFCRTATWGGCNPCTSRLMGLFIHPTPSHPPVHCPRTKYCGN